MVKENKIKEDIKEKKCDCDPDCKCGCHEGKECTCGKDSCSLGDKGCQCGCGCPCKRVLGKVLFLALVFFAGMGVNEFMNDTCMGRCPAKKGMRPMSMMQAPRIYNGNLPAYTDGAGNTIIIVSAGEEASKHGCKCGCNKHSKHHPMKGMLPHHGNPAPAQPQAVQQPSE